MKLIVGLGNPGKEYDKTRHNIGYMSIDKIAEFFNVILDTRKFTGLYTKFNYKDEQIILLKPEKYMNLSGEVIRDFVNFFKINVDDILVICDDLDTPVGTYRLRYQGGTGGHNGLKDIEKNLGTNKYKRIRIGISNDKLRDTKDYVLGKFTKEELGSINTILDKMPMIIKDYLEISFDNLMNKYN
jgi:PTH1 family peptidyl-tRNA hydrolase